MLATWSWSYWQAISTVKLCAKQVTVSGSATGGPVEQWPTQFSVWPTQFIGLPRFMVQPLFVFGPPISVRLNKVSNNVVYILLIVLIHRVKECIISLVVWIHRVKECIISLVVLIHRVKECIISLVVLIHRVKECIISLEL